MPRALRRRQTIIEVAQFELQAKEQDHQKQDEQRFKGLSWQLAWRPFHR
jgi:hypothetical protein